MKYDYLTVTEHIFKRFKTHEGEISKYSVRLAVTTL
jgi:hypothetical protein